MDESGKGDYFGPLVVAACYVGPEHYAELDGVMDSKKLTDSKALELDETIRRHCPFSVISIGPAKYNELYAKMRNLNHLLAWGHAQSIENVLELQECELVISDQFAKDDSIIRRQLKERGKKVRLISRVRAEADLAVAAASVLARAEFLRKLEALGRPFGMNLPKGAGGQVDDAAVRFVRDHGRDQLVQVAKLHFRTTEKLFGPA